ncbi:XRE family transcriptional regulator [Helicobacter apodemus]|uniref:XRE family transcriptional regulator n=1 Tax=Helicobacter apodemus TaxID=135569 RepID=A0A4U8UBE7_9HELI|nr:XRE family transcriptional regulator [Helicobacter apodemus]
MAKNDDNLIKKTCKELGLTYRELGERIGYSEEAISKSARTNKISVPMQRACEMFLQIKELESKVATLNELSLILQKLTIKA